MKNCENNLWWNESTHNWCKYNFEVLVLHMSIAIFCYFILQFHNILKDFFFFNSFFTPLHLSADSVIYSVIVHWDFVQITISNLDRMTKRVRESVRTRKTVGKVQKIKSPYWYIVSHHNMIDILSSTHFWINKFINNEDKQNRGPSSVGIISQFIE